MRRACSRDRSGRGFSWSVRPVSGRSPVHAPPFSTACRAMRFDRGGVDGQGHAVRTAAAERFENRLPVPALGPAIEPIVDRRVGTIVRRAVAPSRTALKHMNDPADDAPIVIARGTRLVRWKTQLDLRPLPIVKPEQPFAHGILPGRIISVQQNHTTSIRYRP
jgi:hypothetical protein